MVDLSIIIVNHNVKDYLQACIQSIYKETFGISFEIIVINNTPHDGASEMIRKEFPDVRIIDNTEIKGYSVNNNQGIKVSRGRYVLLLNPDTIVLDNAFAKMIKFADIHLDAGIFGLKILNPDMSIQNAGGNAIVTPLRLMWNTLLRDVMRIPESVLEHLLHKQRGSISFSMILKKPFLCTKKVRVVMGACFLIRRKVLEEIGVLDENLFFGGEELEYCTRTRINKWTIYYINEAEIIHFVGKSRASLKTVANGGNFNPLINVIAPTEYFFYKYYVKNKFTKIAVLVSIAFMATTNFLRLYIGDFVYQGPKRVTIRDLFVVFKQLIIHGKIGSLYKHG